MKVINIMSDGTVRESMDGVVLPASVKQAYDLIRSVMSRDKQQESEERKAG